MCSAYSESGAPIAPTRCAEYGRLKAENEVLREALKASEDRVTHLERTRYDAHQEVINWVSKTIAQLGKENARLREALKSVEWVDIYGPAVLHCPSCGRTDMSGHAEECKLANALKEVG